MEVEAQGNFVVREKYDNGGYNMWLVMFNTYEEARLYVIAYFQHSRERHLSFEIEDVNSRTFQREMYKEQYHRHYLRSERWQDIRKIVLARDRYKCRDCGAQGPLQLHHTSYRYVNIYPKNYDDLNANFTEEVGDVVTLCERCHKNRHGLE